MGVLPPQQNPGPQAARAPDARSQRDESESEESEPEERRPQLDKGSSCLVMWCDVNITTC